MTTPAVTTADGIPAGLLRHFARGLRPGLYRLRHPVSVRSEMNFWEPEDVAAGGCSAEDVGTPIPYWLHAVRIVTPAEWAGYDAPVVTGAGDDDPALSFNPADLDAEELYQLLRAAERLRHG